MQIAVQGDFLLRAHTHAENDFLLQILLPGVQKRAAKLVFLVSNAADEQVLQLYGTSFLLAAPGWLPVKSWAQKWKYQQQIPAFLKKQPVSLLITEQPAATGKPQIVVLTQPRAINFTGKTGKIIVTTRWAATEMTNLYNIPPEKIAVVPVAPPAMAIPLDWEKKEEIKNSYADSCEYFVFHTQQPAAADLLYLFKAFSVFKKWQKSSMKLVIVNVPETFLPELESYRYRNDVVLLNDADAQLLAAITAGAYAMAYPAPADAMGIPVMQALASEVPVITHPTPALEEIGGEAVLYADAADFATMGQQMIQLYKDESLRNRLALAGRNRVAGNTWQQSSDTFWQVITELTS